MRLRDIWAKIQSFTGETMHRAARWSIQFRVLFLGILTSTLLAQNGSGVFYDFNAEAPGKIHKVSVADLPAPRATKSAVNPPEMSPRPVDAIPKTLPGFKVNMYATGLDEPRELRAAPNGDVFVAESDKGEIAVFRGVTKDGKAEQTSTFATGLHDPFGIAFFPPGSNPEWVYIGNTDSVVRFPYRTGDLKARATAQTIVAEIGRISSHRSSLRARRNCRR
ncbi:MAG: hypothetical protein DMG93_18435 [Acidobacteria bacterium]|nr:MAG: hypothetical protein DMG93_18435 [Acidobacteriota bacterium]